MRELRNIGIAGAGTMGATIAVIFAEHGYDVFLYDKFEKALERANEIITVGQKAAVEAGERTEAEAQELIARIEISDDLNKLAACDFIVEAIVENLDIKQAFWKELSEMTADDVILATNTSGLSITKIAEAVKNPERFAGMHWINPSHLIPLVEVISGEKTDPAAAQAVIDLAKSVGKVAVDVKKDVPGFILNRIQFCILREAMHLVEEGVGSIEDIDNVMKYGLGMRYACFGPFEVADMGGLDIFHNISDYLFEDLSTAEKPHDMLVERFKSGNFGVKSGEGFYDYADGRGEEVVKKRDKAFIQLSELLHK
jgi:3-hydroxybutyryl-CoA dehydrogenase